MNYINLIKKTILITNFGLVIFINSLIAQNSTCIYTPYNKSFLGNYCDSVITINNNSISILNADFESGTSGWSYIPNSNRAKIIAPGYNSSNCVQLKSQNNSAGDAMITQTIAALMPGGIYNLSAMMSSNLITNNNVLSVNLNIRFNYPNGNYTTFTQTFFPTQNWSLAQFQFTVPSTPNLLLTQIQVLVYRGQNNNVLIDDIKMTASQPIANTPAPFSFVNTNVPIAPTEIFFEEFKGNMGSGLSCDKWLAVKKTWGNNYVLNNNGVVPENLELVCGGGMRFHGHGDLYNGPILGNTTHLGNGKIRVGSCIATKNYYASGLYEVEAKLTPGMVNAFWTFHYIEDAAFQNGGIKNSEIDWEFPSNIISGPKNSIQDGLCNTWGGLCNGEGFHSTTSVNSSLGDLSQSFHKYSIEWHSGGNGIAPSVKWYIDSILVKTETNTAHVPFRASRFWLGVWYGNSNWITGGDASVMQYSDKFMEVKSVKITPYYEANDVYENETVPSDGFTTPNNYPTFPCSPIVARMSNSSENNDDFSEPMQQEIVTLLTKNNLIILDNSQFENYISTVYLYNINGQLITTYHNTFHNKEIQIAFNNSLSNGIYVLKTIDNLGKQQMSKITFNY